MKKWPTSLKMLVVKPPMLHGANRPVTINPGEEQTFGLGRSVSHNPDLIGAGRALFTGTTDYDCRDLDARTRPDLGCHALNLSYLIFFNIARSDRSFATSWACGSNSILDACESLPICAVCGTPRLVRSLAACGANRQREDQQKNASGF